MSARMDPFLHQPYELSGGFLRLPFTVPILRSPYSDAGSLRLGPQTIQPLMSSGPVD